MAPSTQHNLLTAEKSRLGKVPDLAMMLQSEQAWSTLPQDVREQIYTLLPAPIDSEPPRDPNVNPLAIERLRPYIEQELRRWQGELVEGKETRRWRGEGMQASKDHADGEFDGWKFMAREEYWGKHEEVTAETGEEGKADGVTLNAEDAGNKQQGEKTTGSTKVTERSVGSIVFEGSETSIEIMDGDDEEGEF